MNGGGVRKEHHTVHFVLSTQPPAVPMTPKSFCLAKTYKKISTMDISSSSFTIKTVVFLEFYFILGLTEKNIDKRKKM